MLTLLSVVHLRTQFFRYPIRFHSFRANIRGNNDFMLNCITVSRLVVQCFTSPPTQYRLYGRRFLQVKRPNQQYQSTEGKSQKKITQRTKKTHNTHAYTQNGKTNTAYNYNTTSPLVYNNMGWLGDSSHRGQGCQAWTAVGLPPRYPRYPGVSAKHSGYLSKTANSS